MYKNRGGYLPLILAIAVVAIVAVGGYFWFGPGAPSPASPSPIPAPTPTPTPAPISPAPAPAPQPGPITIEGRITCLPKVGPGPHTLECAIGLRGDDGNHYGLRNLSQHDPNYKISGGERVRVTGTFSAEAMSGPGGSQYDVAGVIDISSIIEL